MPPDAQNDFDRWWESLLIPGSLDGVPVDRATALVIWQAAQASAQATFALLEEHAQANASLAASQPLEDAAFIADRFLGGRLTYCVAERSAWQSRPKRIVRAFDSKTHSVTIAVCPEAPPTHPRSDRHRR